MIPGRHSRAGELQTDLLPTSRVVEVAICTFRRPSLVATLESIAAQRCPAGIALRVIVADNDEQPSARPLVEATAARLRLDCRYVHAPWRNISVARNACLDAASAPLFAFIDDDETAPPGWIAALVAQMDATDADAVLGPACATYPEGIASWVLRADMHSTRPPVTTFGAIRTGYSCNVLLRREAFDGRRFDVALGRSGGEDDIFFASAVRGGAKLAFAPDAFVDDPVPPARANLRWLCRRSFRNGQTHARNMLAAGEAWPRALAVAVAKAAIFAVATIATLPFAARWRRMLVRGALHVGACAHYLGKRDLELY